MYLHFLAFIPPIYKQAKCTVQIIVFWWTNTVSLCMYIYSWHTAVFIVFIINILKIIISKTIIALIIQKLL